MKKICDLFLNPLYLGLFVAGACVVALGSALVMQYGFQILPCHLCYEQRKPYVANILMGLVAALVSKKYPRTALVLLGIAAVIFLENAGIAVYHYGTEKQWWPLGEGCGGEGNTPPAGASIEELKRYFEHRPVVRCDVPGFVLFGISLTGYNFLLSVFLAFFTLFHAVKGYCRDKKSP